MKRPAPSEHITSFGLKPGRVLARRYQVESLLGSGWEGEVYLIREIATNIKRAAKFFFPQRNPKDHASSYYAKKLYKLRHCPILIQYHTQDTITFRRRPVTFLVSDYVKGRPLAGFLREQTGGRLTVFEGMHLLRTLAAGIEPIHNLREYHGDIHDENVLIQRFGVGFDLKLLDMFKWRHSTTENIHDDVCDMIRVFYDAIGGARRYARQPPVVKKICCGLKRSLILKKYKTAGQLRQYLDTMPWE